MRETIILEHVVDVLASRANAYGPAAECFAEVAARWSSILGCQVSPAQVALCMIDLKMARLVHNPDHRDSLIDVIGYATLLADLQSPQSSEEHRD